MGRPRPPSEAVVGGEVSSRVVWGMGEAAEVGPGLSHPPLPAPAESGFIKGWMRQTILKYFLKRRPKAYIAFSLNKIV